MRLVCSGSGLPAETSRKGGTKGHAGIGKKGLCLGRGGSALADPIRDGLKIIRAERRLRERHLRSATKISSGQLLKHVASFWVCGLDHLQLAAALDRRHANLLGDLPGAEAMADLTRTAIEERHDITSETTRFERDARARVKRAQCSRVWAGDRGHNQVQTAIVRRLPFAGRFTAGGEGAEQTEAEARERPSFTSFREGQLVSLSAS